jgi:predicted nucleic acid-binding protein
VKSHSKPEKYFLLDSSIIVAYYLPESSRSKKAAERVTDIIDYVRKGGTSDWLLIVPNIVVAEVFNAFSKYCYGKWNEHVKKNLPGGMDQRRYKRIRNKFRDHIHNGKLYHQIELNRHHVLYTDLISPLDHYYRIYRKRSRVVPLQTMDVLILAMGIELSHMLGHERFCVITADHRMNDLCSLLNSRKRVAALRKADLASIAGELNLEISSELFPRVLKLSKATRAELVEEFGEWPLNIPRRSRTGV